MQAKMLVCISIILVSFGQWVVAGEIRVHSVHSDQTGNVSIVVDVPPDTKPKASQFRLIEDNNITVTASSIKPFKNSDWKLAIVLCIDKSGSINDAQLEKTKSALKNLLRKHPFKKQDRLALVSFENEPRVIQWFTDPQKIYEKINELENMKGQHTVLYDALFDSLGHLDSDGTDASPPVLKRILVISDGENYGGSRQNTTEVRKKALDTGVAIDVVLLNAKQKDVKTMHSLANDTGGQFANTNSSGTEAAIDKIFEVIMGSYVVYFERKVKTASSKTARVGVQLERPNKKFVTDIIQAEILQSASVQVEPLPPKKNVQLYPPPEKIDPTPPGIRFRLWLIFVVLLAAVLLAFALWRSRQKNGQIESKAIEPKVEPNEKISAPAPSSPSQPQTLRRKTLVGSYYFPIPEPNTPTAILICLSGPLEGKQFSMAKETFHIGANLENDLCIAEDEYVSGDHAYLRYEDGGLILFDKGSSNGTFVNDAKISGTGFVLKPGVHISIGTSVFEVVSPTG